MSGVARFEEQHVFVLGDGIGGPKKSTRVGLWHAYRLLRVRARGEVRPSKQKRKVWNPHLPRDSPKSIKKNDRFNLFIHSDQILRWLNVFRSVSFGFFGSSQKWKKRRLLCVIYSHFDSNCQVG